MPPPTFLAWFCYHSILQDATASYPIPFLQPVSLTFGQASESPGKFVKTHPSRVSESAAPLGEGQECTFLTRPQAIPLLLSQDDTLPSPYSSTAPT